MRHNGSIHAMNVKNHLFQAAIKVTGLDQIMAVSAAWSIRCHVAAITVYLAITPCTCTCSHIPSTYIVMYNSLTRLPALSGGSWLMLPSAAVVL